MKGMVIKSNISGQEYLEVGLKDGLVSVIINLIQLGEVNWIVNGLDLQKSIHYTYANGSLKVGDKIEIELSNIDNSISHLSETSHSSLNDCIASEPIEEENPNIWQRKLDTYYRLKAIFEDESMI